jgi:hypothetical protein
MFTLSGAVERLAVFFTSGRNHSRPSEGGKRLPLSTKMARFRCGASLPLPELRWFNAEESLLTELQVAVRSSFSANSTVKLRCKAGSVRLLPLFVIRVLKVT